MNCFQYMCSTQLYIENDILLSLTSLVKEEKHNSNNSTKQNESIRACVEECKKYIKTFNFLNPKMKGYIACYDGYAVRQEK